MNAASQKGLGKGLSALMGEEYSQTAGAEKSVTDGDEPTGASLKELAVEIIHSGQFQPRTHFDEVYLNELADSIEKNGVMQPIIVRPSRDKDGQFEIIAGERRWRASKLAKVETIPALIRDIDDQLALELALVENIQRQDLSVLEEATGFQRLIQEFGYTQEELAHTVGKSRSHIANLLRLLALPEKIKTYLENDALTMGHARALLNATDPEKFADIAVKQGLNVRQIEALVKSKGESTEPGPTKRAAEAKARPSRSPSAKEKDPDIIALEETLSDNLGLHVSIDDHGGQKGEVIINYQTLNQLDDILRRLSDSV